MQTTTNSNNMDGSDSTENIQNLSAKKRKVVCALGRPEVSSTFTNPLTGPLDTKIKIVKDQSKSLLDPSNIFGSLVSFEKKSKEKDQQIKKLEKSLDKTRKDLEKNKHKQIKLQTSLIEENQNLKESNSRAIILESEKKGTFRST
jgi:septal ring factor EnvC (AmiA/AmiB activator)